MNKCSVLEAPVAEAENDLTLWDTASVSSRCSAMQGKCWPPNASDPVLRPRKALARSAAEQLREARNQQQLRLLARRSAASPWHCGASFRAEGNRVEFASGAPPLFASSGTCGGPKMVHWPAT